MSRKIKSRVVQVRSRPSPGTNGISLISGHNFFSGNRTLGGEMGVDYTFSDFFLSESASRHYYNIGPNALIGPGKNYAVTFEFFSRLISSILGEEYQKSKIQLEQLTEKIEYCTHFIRSIEHRPTERPPIATLSPIMVNLIEKAKHDENILKMLYETTDEGEIIFNLILGEIDAECYRKSAEIEVELSERYEDLNITVNPVYEDEIIIDEKYQFYVK